MHIKLDNSKRNTKRRWWLTVAHQIARVASLAQSEVAWFPPLLLLCGPEQGCWCKGRSPFTVYSEDAVHFSSFNWRCSSWIQSWLLLCKQGTCLHSNLELLHPSGSRCEVQVIFSKCCSFQTMVWIPPVVLELPLVVCRCRMCDTVWFLLKVGESKSIWIYCICLYSH